MVRLDPLACKPPDGALRSGNCSTYGFGVSGGFDPIFKKVSLWKKSPPPPGPSPPPGSAQASELREYSSPNCTGAYTIGSIDVMDQCTVFHIPLPASTYVAQTGATTYESYHYQGATDCSGPRTAEGSFAVGTCSDTGGGSSTLRVWLTNSTRYCTPGCECCPCSESHNDTAPGEKTALFSPFIYKMHYFTKTGSGQS